MCKFQLVPCRYNEIPFLEVFLDLFQTIRDAHRISHANFARNICVTLDSRRMHVTFANPTQMLGTDYTFASNDWIAINHELGVAQLR
jgi:hypothetical protein